MTFEAAFPKDFRREDIAKILKFVMAGKFCQLVCIPGGGKATMLRLLVNNPDLVKFHLGQKSRAFKFVYINLQELDNFEKTKVLKFMLFALDDKIKAADDSLRIKKQIKETVTAICQKTSLVLLFDHFDEIQNQLTRSFFQFLKDLRSLAKYKFASVFATRRNLDDLVDEKIAKDFWDFFVGNKVYLKVFEKQAVDFLFNQLENVFGQKLTTSQKEAILNLSGGHAKLTKVITELLFHQNVDLKKDVLLKAKPVRAALYEIWLFLTPQEQQTLYEISQKSTSAPPVILRREIESHSMKRRRILVGDSSHSLRMTTERLVKLDLIREINQSQQFNPLRPRSEASNSTIQPASPARSDSDSRRAKRGEQYSFTIPLFGDFVRSLPAGAAEPKIIFNPETNEIKKGENTISELLSSQEYRLLKFLIENRGRVVEREELIEAVWPQTQVIEAISDEAIDQMIFRLRKKIERQPAEPKHLLTVKGRGFRFTP